MSPISTLKDPLTIIHFNDVYDICAQKKEPVGGATRFCTAVKNFRDLDPLLFFSGDCFAPSLLSAFTKGEQMVPVLNALNTSCAVYGNHDFDFGVDVLAEHVEKTKFPWLMSNVIDNETEGPLGDGSITYIIEHKGWKIGLMGLVEVEWLATLSTIDPDAVTFTDYVEVGNQLAEKLRGQGCDLIIALTHMRLPNDERLARESKGIDLILGGHDHMYRVCNINGVQLVKSGTDFRDFSVVTVCENNADKVDFDVQRISVTSDYKEDEDLKKELQEYEDMMKSKLNDILGEFHADLDGRFEVVRTRESNLGNFMCDIMLASCNGDCVILNSGTLRSDRIHAPGPFSMKDLMTILPIMDSLVVLKASGQQLIDALENGVSQYPKLEGRFPQVAGIRFAFDPSKPVGSRVDPKFVKIGDEYVHPHQFYRLVTKYYVATGHDGYTCLANCEILTDADECLELTIAVRNHFHAIKMVKGLTRRNSRHHQSLITMSRRHSLLRSMSAVQDLSPSIEPIERTLSLSPRPSLSRQGNVVEDMEKDTCKLAPRIEGRIVIIKDKETLHKLMNERKTWEANLAIVEEDENSSPTTSPVTTDLMQLYGRGGSKNSALLSHLRTLHDQALARSRNPDSSGSVSREVSPCQINVIRPS